MMVFPPICIAACFALYRWMYRLDERTAGTVADLRGRGEIAADGEPRNAEADIDAGG